MKNIVILGGGFAGIAATKALVAHRKDITGQISLIDANSFHLFTPSLYEVATSEEPKKNIAVPFREIFPRFVFVHRHTVKNLDPRKKTVFFDNKTRFPYDYLIIALGSVCSYFHIPGLEEYGLPLKSVSDALKIKRAVLSAYHKKALRAKPAVIVVGGGGFSGTELAAELITLRNRLAKHYERESACLEIHVIQGSDCLLKELDSRVSKIAQKRLEEGGVTVHLGEHVKRVGADIIETDDGHRYPYDVCIWTGGVRPNIEPLGTGFCLTQRGHLKVNSFLQVEGFENVFAAGDISEYQDPVSKEYAPGVAQVAEDEGRIAGENVFNLLKGLRLSAYTLRHSGYIVPLRGRYAVADLKRLSLVGFFGWALQQFVFLRYLIGITGILRAFRRWNTFEKELVFRK